MTTTTKENTHTISILVANKPGVLVRVAQVFARRGYNIDSLVVSPAFNPKYSRMTITAQGDLETLDQIIKQCDKLIDVLSAEEHTKMDALQKELALIKIKNIAQNRKDIEKYKRKFGLKVLEENKEVIIVEQSGTTEELDEFESLFDASERIEMVRSGKLVMAKGKEHT